MSVSTTRLGWTALPILLAWPGMAVAAQAAPAEARPTDGDALPAPVSLTSSATPPATPAPTDPQVNFSADQVIYDSEADIVTAQGRVRLDRDGNYVAADQLVWTRKTGEVVATGNVVVVNPQGDKLIGDKVTLTDSLRDGTIDNLLVVLESGGRIAATRGVRVNGVTTLENAVYSPCPVTNPRGCPKNPSWKIVAAKVVQDPTTHKITFRGGRLNLFGITLPLLPIFSVGSGGSGGSGGTSGAMVPDIAFSSSNGLELALPYYWRPRSNLDFTVTPHIYSKTLPAIEGRFRNLNKLGAYQIGAFLTYGRIDDPDPNAINPNTRRNFRGYIEANGKFQLDPYWSITGSLRAASDKTVTRRYDLSRDDVLRNFIDIERIDPTSYISIAGWAFQGLRVDDHQRSIPIALPAIDARFILPTKLAGGTIQVQGNSLAILRIDGQDTQRAFASARWDLRKLTRMGQELTLTAFARGDIYHTSDSADTTVAAYAGRDGWHFRGIGALAADVRWPFIGPAFGGTQRLTPRVQVVLTPPTPNFVIPNEDARSIDLEDSNLFALNRFPGYDRWEDGSRITYGVEWTLDRPNVSIDTIIGQSYRLTRAASIFPEGTGLTDRFSDIVGRTRVRFGRFIDLTHRFRIEKGNFAPRRNELDLTIGTDQTYAQIGYLRLNRNISSKVEDLRDKEELRLAARIKFARYWSVFGATVINLTDAKEDPLSLADGYEPVRHRLGVAYEDECLELGLSWKRDYERIGEFRKGSTFALRIALKGLGR